MVLPNDLQQGPWITADSIEVMGVLTLDLSGADVSLDQPLQLFSSEPEGSFQTIVVAGVSCISAEPGSQGTILFFDTCSRAVVVSLFA